MNAFYTEKLVQEVTTGVTTSDIKDLSGQGRISQAGYESFKKEVMKKVNAFYTKPSFDGKTYTTEMVFDLPNSIAIIGHGEYIGKDAVFE